MPEKIFNEWLHNFYGKQRLFPRKEASNGMVAKENAQKIKIIQKKRKLYWNTL